MKLLLFLGIVALLSAAFYIGVITSKYQPDWIFPVAIVLGFSLVIYDILTKKRL